MTATRLLSTLPYVMLPALAGLTTLGAAGSWTRQPDMPTPRSAHAVVATGSSIYVLGGTGPDGQPVTTVDRFDGRSWTSEGTIPGEGLNAPAAASVGSSVYLIGGFGTTTNSPRSAVLRYDVKTRKWSEAAPLPAPRGGHAAAVLNGRIHVIGGGNSQSTIDDHSVYDPQTNTWTSKRPLPRSMGSPAAVVVNGRLYSIGGRSGPNDFGDVHIYDPQTDAWVAGPSIEPRGTGGAAVIDGTIYYFGGESQAKRTVLGDVLRLKPGENEWTADAPLPTPRSYGRAVLVKNAIYIVGGSTQFGASHSSRGSAAVERFSVAPQQRAR
jgi:N-acetylneuraminic acid mutarotase